MRVQLYSSPLSGRDAERFLQHCEATAGYNPADHHEALFKGMFPEDPVMELTGAQDYVALRGQGVIADRSTELLGASDLGIMTLRKIFWRELEAIQEGRPTKQWRRLPAAVELPTQPGIAAGATA